MEKLQSSFKNMVLSLVIISMVAAGALAGIYILTLANINAQKKAKQEAAKMAVIAGHEDGVAIETTVDGFGGPIRMMVGFDAEGNVLGYEILEHQETPGLGSHMIHWFKNAAKAGQNIIGRKAGNLAVSKDGGDVDAITAATITSRAFLKGINQAYAEFMGTEATTGASQLHKEQKAMPDVEAEAPQGVEPNVVHIHGEKVVDNTDPEAELEAEQLQDAQELEEQMEMEVDHE